ncbi:hypothetical protein K7432_014741 [Basidiobolus ranarum]|uniref:C3H1-type domain-containing protein n=1 Tax=Basidiobolus ranarum TaxID=34480 RepID=A0ABR2WH59_9FUNG
MDSYAKLGFPILYTPTKLLPLNIESEQKLPYKLPCIYGDLMSSWWPKSRHERSHSCDSLASSNDLSIPNSSDSEDLKSLTAFEGEDILLPDLYSLTNQLPTSQEGLIGGCYNDIYRNDDFESKERINLDLKNRRDRGSKKGSLYKTEFCRSYEETGFCRYGSKCQFAHSSSELRVINRHPKYKTVVCKTFWEQGTCPYGKRCCFIHHSRTNNPKQPNTWDEYAFQPNSHIRRNSTDMPLNIEEPSRRLSQPSTHTFQLPTLQPNRFEEVKSKCPSKSPSKRLPIFQHIG